MCFLTSYCLSQLYIENCNFFQGLVFQGCLPVAIEIESNQVKRTPQEYTNELII